MAPKRKAQPVLGDEAHTLRTPIRAGQDAPDADFYKGSRKLSKMARKDLLRGHDVTHAQYEEAEFLATQSLFRHNAHELNFTSEETYDVRGELMDAQAESFPSVDQDTRDRDVPRAWR